MDLLVSCILSARLAQTGQPNDDLHMDRIVETFVEKLSRHLSYGREYLILMSPSQTSPKRPSVRVSSLRLKVRRAAAPRR